MKRKWKVVIAVVVLVGGSIAVFAGVRYSHRGIVTVETGRVVRQDLTSLVTASGEIKPRKYINIGANATGQLTEIPVIEGQHVQKGQLLARIENTQPEADVNAQQASLSSAEADAAATEEGLKASDDNLVTMQAGVDRAKADLEHASLDMKRSEELYKNKLIPKQDYDTRQATYQSAVASLNEAQAKLVQARAQREQTNSQLYSAQRHVTQVRATVTRAADVLKKYDSFAPLAGVVTNLPVRVGETVIPGLPNLPGTTIMTIADMSIITAEVKVDETDIVSVKLEQQADVTIDAIPNKTFKGHVIEIGDTAIIRSTGVAASQSTTSSQEAKDFKVVVALDNPPEDIRPGLSCTAKITTATRQHTLTIPIQALTIRQKGDLEPKPKSGVVVQAAKFDPAAEKARKEEIQGVFVVSANKAQFRKVETGITGATDIEVLNGLKEGDEIVTGSYQVIRTIRPDASVKVDNKAPVKTEA
ncbi:MAG TPA: efflux RND transporter periplasmic adaptor subunit [Bryobacteraceae bacterium]|nr:efflux RND transporter periplasmic adaptor subunit [Bryobacteraceae bacterium]